MKRVLYFMIGFFTVGSLLSYYITNDKMTAYFYCIMMFLTVILKVLKESIENLKDKDEHCNCGK